MVTEVVAYVAGALFEAGYAYTAIAVAEYGVIAIEVLAVVASVYQMQEDARRQRNAYNDSLKDRYTMIRSATEPRAVVLGRQRVSGPIAYIGSYGAYREHLVMAVVLAAHEIDAVEAIYFDNEQVTLDGTGAVLYVNRRDQFTITTASAVFTLSSVAYGGSVTATVAYGSTITALTVVMAADGVTATVSGATAGTTGTVVISYRPYASPWGGTLTSVATRTVVLDASGNGSVTLASVPTGPVNVVCLSVSADGSFTVDLTPYASLAGSVVTITGASQVSVTAVVSYPAMVSNSATARVTVHLGAAGQTADADMVTYLPGVWDTSHTMSGMAYLVCEFSYNTDAFPSGIPNVSALVRGAKCYDPRSGLTAWSENPALLMRYVATSPLMGRLSAAQIKDSTISAAANVCDTATSYNVGGRIYSRPLYKAGIVVKANLPPKSALDDIAKAMAGHWVFQNGTMSVKAGGYVTPLQTLDETWLANTSSVQVKGGSNRTDLVNFVTGKFVDEQRDYIVSAFDPVTAASYIALDGATLPLDVMLNAVTFVGQAQQVIATQMRDVRMGMQVVLTCNMRAFAVEVFDTLYVTLSRFGWVNQVVEVLDRTWSADGGIQLTLKATDPSIYALGATFSSAGIPPNTRFPSPWEVPAVSALACVSGDAQILIQADGTVQTRVLVTWAPITDQLVNSDGGVEVRYGIAGTPDATWQSVLAPRGQSQCYLTQNIRDGAIYLVKARAYNALVKGTWSNLVTHQVVFKSTPPDAPASVTAVSEPYGVRLSCVKSLDPTVIGYSYRVGATWASGIVLQPLGGTNYLWQTQATGSYVVWVAALDAFGHYSTAVSTTATVAGPTLSSLTYTLSGANLALTWTGVPAGFAIASYEVRQGASWAVGSTLGQYSVNTYVEVIRWTGTRTYWVAPIDVHGNYGTASMVSVTLNVPGAVTGGYATVIDNNVLLYWSAPTIGYGQLAIASYEVRKGATWVGGTVIGSNGNSTFAGVFEQASGVYTYWIAAIDSAGNYGAPAGVTATVSQPPDFVFRNNFNSTLAGTLTNLYFESGALLGPVDITQTWATHFSSHAWASPQDQITAGFPVYADPSLTSGAYEEIIDYGAAIPLTVATATLAQNQLAGVVNITCTLSWKLLSINAWTVMPSGASQLIPQSFRYLRVHYDFAGTAGANLMQITGLNVRLSVKNRNDSGSGTSVVGGVAVTFGYAFVAADTPIVQANGLDAFSKPYTAAVIYTGTSNPTGFSVRIFNSAGTEVAGVTFAWTVRGY